MFRILHAFIVLLYWSFDYLKQKRLDQYTMYNYFYTINLYLHFSVSEKQEYY